MSTPQMTLGQGWQPYILKGVQAIVGTDACPYMKIDNYGTVNMLQSQNKPKDITTLNRTDSPGQVNTVQFKYLKRAVEASVMNTDTCTQTNTQLWSEGSITTSMFSAYALYLTDEILTHYANEAVSMIQLGTPATSITYEFIQQLSAACNAIYSNMNRNLSTKLYANIGVNRLTGNNSSVAINIEQNTTNLPLGNGVTKILTDYVENLGYGKPWVVGSGLMHNYFNQQRAKGIAQNGLMTAIEAGDMNFYYDSQASSLLGANQIIVGQPDSVQMIESFKFKGFRAGYKGTSYFFTFMLPIMATPNRVEFVEFDGQLKYYDCPDNSFTDYTYGTPINVNRGWNLIISKSYDLFTIPADSYQSSDPLFGNNGLLRYTIANV